MTGLEVEAVLADLATFHPVRNRPLGEVETFSGKLGGQQATEPIDITTDDYGAILFRFRGGARGSLYVSQVTAGRKNCNRYEIAGANCALAWCSERPEELWIGRRDKANEILLRDPALMDPAARPFTRWPGGHCEGHPESFRELFRLFYEYIAAGDMKAAPAFPTFEDGHREVALCEAILKSHRQQRWVSL
ncbi:MAG: hypothetical protein GX591_12090 [Planctomycetes bacterium]|nr:hypothetical protein [Planctomycetota bacterium]